MVWSPGTRESGWSKPSRSGDPANLETPPDLHTQFEDVVNAVLTAEADWLFYDRLALADLLWRARSRNSER